MGSRKDTQKLGKTGREGFHHHWDRAGPMASVADRRTVLKLMGHEWQQPPTLQAGGEAEELLQWEAKLLHQKMAQVLSAKSHKQLQCKMWERMEKKDCIVFMIILAFLSLLAFYLFICLSIYLAIMVMPCNANVIFKIWHFAKIFIKKINQIKNK